MAELSKITEFLNKSLNTNTYTDDSQNGLQVESDNNKITKVAVAVDSGLSVIDQAIKLKSELLIVHHGIFWNNPYLISGVLGHKINLLLKNGCSLYASHLPLDGSLKFGNAALLAKYLGFKNCTPFFKYKSSLIGAKVRIQKKVKLEDVIEKCKKIPASINPIVLPFGKKEIKYIGIVTGSGSSALESCALEKIDLLISGEAKHSAYHTAKELKLNAIFAGHYATETFGVKALGKELEKKFNIKSYFIDEPTGI